GMWEVCWIFLSQLSDAYWYGFLHRSEHIITDETKLRHTKLCTGLQGFVLLWSATCFYDKKLAQEDKKSPCANALSQVTNTI
ncbi:TPA: hypothetical protein ACGGPN_005051, partial [Escherichia coli]